MRAVAVCVAVTVALSLAPRAQEATFRARTNLVRIDVLATNGRHPITDLTAADFEIRDNGTRQTVDFMRFEELPLNLTLLKSCDVCGVFWGAFAARDPRANAAHVDTLFQLWRKGMISPRISATYPLARAGEAIRAMSERRVVGKLVVTLD